MRGWDPNRKWGVGVPWGLVWLEIEGGTLSILVPKLLGKATLAKTAYGAVWGNLWGKSNTGPEEPVFT